ncbi:hypothetical protein TRAPUB_4007 [Trametes pubescens]|uniref:Uncharacterized protein n=1 Tax=Trametes pubescens TaxID=154538 RepID=A0A1M2VC59_TRAPU|nr:hypothetical protein TRAPUB_4007 [Trametes pubescens]
MATSNVSVLTSFLTAPKALNLPSSLATQRNRTKKDLENLVAQLEESIATEVAQREGLANELQAAMDNIAQLKAAAIAAAATHERAMFEAIAKANAANAAATAATAAAAAAAAAADGPPVPRPTGNVRHLQEWSGLSKEDYRAVQRTIRNLVIIANLDWTDDFRRQNAENLARLYRAAREEHPVLKRFQNNWLTAELAKQFLQNKCKHAVKQGYVDRASIRTGTRRARR